MILRENLNRLCVLPSPLAWCGVVQARRDEDEVLVFMAVSFIGEEPCSFCALLDVERAGDDAEGEIARLTADAVEYFAAEAD